MRVLVIPDIHQSLCGIEYIKENHSSVDMVVFMGDALDCWDSQEYISPSHPQSPQSILSSLKEIKDSLGEKFIWLLGNHDMAYLPPLSGDSSPSSGHQWEHEEEISQCLLPLLSQGYIQISSLIDGVYYSHAGFSKSWYLFAKSSLKELMGKGKNSSPKEFLSSLNLLISSKEYINMGLYNKFFSLLGENSYGDSICEGPLWIRPKSIFLSPSPIFLKQVVGHTEMKEPRLMHSGKQELLLVDTHSHDSFFIVEDGNLHIEGIFSQELSSSSLRDERVLRKNHNRRISLPSYYEFH